MSDAEGKKKYKWKKVMLSKHNVRSLGYEVAGEDNSKYIKTK